MLIRISNLFSFQDDVLEPFRVYDTENSKTYVTESSNSKDCFLGIPLVDHEMGIHYSLTEIEKDYLLGNVFVKGGDSLPTIKSDGRDAKQILNNMDYDSEKDSFSFSAYIIGYEAIQTLIDRLKQNSDIVYLSSSPNISISSKSYSVKQCVYSILLDSEHCYNPPISDFISRGDRAQELDFLISELSLNLLNPESLLLLNSSTCNIANAIDNHYKVSRYSNVISEIVFSVEKTYHKHYASVVNREQVEIIDSPSQIPYDCYDRITYFFDSQVDWQKYIKTVFYLRFLGFSSALAYTHNVVFDEPTLKLLTNNEQSKQKIEEYMSLPNTPPNYISISNNFGQLFIKRYTSAKRDVELTLIKQSKRLRINNTIEGNYYI